AADRLRIVSRARRRLRVVARRPRVHQARRRSWARAAWVADVDAARTEDLRCARAAHLTLRADGDALARYARLRRRWRHDATALVRASRCAGRAVGPHPRR